MKGRDILTNNAGKARLFGVCHWLLTGEFLQSRPMKLPSVSTLAAAFFAVLASQPCSTAFADIQDPPMRENTPIRKLGRGVGNLVYGSSELVLVIDSQNTSSMSNSASFSHGLVNGLGRTLVRMGAGIYEILTFPVPTYRSSYRPVLPSATPWVKSGYEEFPPELGFDSRMDYCRNQGATSRMP